MIGDNCRTIPVGQVSPQVERLLEVTEQSLYLGISKALSKKRVGDVSEAVQTHVESSGFAVITNFVGHGVGRTLHEELKFRILEKQVLAQNLKREWQSALNQWLTLRVLRFEWLRMVGLRWQLMACLLLISNTPF